jgi:hypothetical protein
MCIIPKKIKANPLNGMKDYQGYPKENKIYYSKWIRQNFLHDTKIKNHFYRSGFLQFFILPKKIGFRN